MDEATKKQIEDGMSCLYEIKASDIKEINSFKSPPQTVFKVFQAVFYILLGRELNWENIRKETANHKELIH